MGGSWVIVTPGSPMTLASSSLIDSMLCPGKMRQLMFAPARCGNMRAHQGAERKPEWQKAEHAIIARPRQIPVQHTVRRCPPRLPVQIHQKEGQIIARINPRQRLIEFQSVKGGGPALPEAQIP